MKVLSAAVLSLFATANAFTPRSSAHLATSALHMSTAAASSSTTPITEGSPVPNITWKTRTRIDSNDENPFDWKDLTSDDLFKGKRIVLFSLPGAFTPTCSSTHLPGYEKEYDRIKSLGIDEIYCLSVNDAFVMNQWGKHLGVSNVK